MKLHDLLPGLLVLALLGGGVYLARVGVPHALRPEDVPVTAGAGNERATLEKLEALGNAGAFPDLTPGEASAGLGDLRVTVAVSPHPPVAFEKNTFRVRVVSPGGPVPLVDGRISFEMKMPMGDHRYSLVAAPDGSYVAEVVLPFCPSGDPRWYALVEGTAGAERVSLRFRFDLAKAAAPSAP